MERTYRLGEEDIVIEICPGVYEPSDDTFLMARSVIGKGKCLEIGTGSGFTAIYLGKKGFDVACSDIDQKAVECAGKNMKRNGVNGKCIKSDLFQNIEGKFDTIIFNPPYLPTTDSIEESIQWDGGPDGFSVTERFLKEARDHIADRGNIFIILSSLTDIESFMKKFPCFSFRKISEESFFFEKIYCFELSFNRESAL